MTQGDNVLGTPIAHELILKFNKRKLYGGLKNRYVPRNLFWTHLL